MKTFIVGDFHMPNIIGHSHVHDHSHQTIKYVKKFCPGKKHKKAKRKSINMLLKTLRKLQLLGEYNVGVFIDDGQGFMNYNGGSK